MEPAVRNTARTPRYLTPEDITHLAPPEWLLDGFLIEGGLTVLYGAPKTGKTMLALDWALTIERGTQWYNRKTKQGRVLYNAGEGLLGLGNRINAWSHVHGAAPKAGPVFRDPIVDLIGVGGPEQFLREMAVLKLEPKLIIIDTLAKSMVGGDENSAEDMGRAIDGADKLRNATGAAVMLLHHTTKSSDHVMRGSSALLGAADTVLGLVKQRDGAITLSVTAARDFESGGRFDLTMVKAGASALLVPFENAPEVFGQEHVDTLVALAGCTEIGRPASRAQWKDATKLDEMQFKRMLASLSKYVDRTQDGVVAYFEINPAGYEMLDIATRLRPTEDLSQEWHDPWDAA